MKGDIGGCRCGKTSPPQDRRHDCPDSRAENGEVDAVYIESVNADQFLQRGSNAKKYKKSHFGRTDSHGIAYMCRPEFGDIVQYLNAGLRKFKKTAEYTALCDRYPSIDCDPNEAQWLDADHPTTRADIVIATEAAWRPFNYIEDGELKGFDIELTKAVCKAAGKICAIVTVPWQSVWPEGYPEFGWDTNPKMYPGIGTNSGWFHCTSGTINTLRRQPDKKPSLASSRRRQQQHTRPQRRSQQGRMVEPRRTRDSARGASTCSSISLPQCGLRRG